MKRLSIIALLLCSAICQAGPDDDAITLLHLAAAKQKAANAVKSGCGCFFGDVCKCAPGKCDCVTTLSYADASALAIREGKPLIVFLDGPRYVQNFATHVPGAICCSVESLTGFVGPVVIVSVPRDGALWHTKTLPAWSTSADIAKEVGRTTAASFRPVLSFQSSGIDCSGGT